MHATAELPQAPKAEPVRALNEADPEHQEAQSIDTKDWLARIGTLWQQGDQQQAKAELIEFRTHFPRYALDVYCESYEGLCDLE